MPDPSRLPPALAPGARVLVVAPSGPPRDLPRLAAGLDALRAQGLVVETLRGAVPLDEAFAPHGFLSAPDEARLDELNRALRDPDAAAVFCVRGGYGALRLLPGLDYAAARRHPKLLVGYSDITALHLALYRHAGWRGLSGPMVGVEWADLDAASAALFWDLARGGTPAPLVGPGGEALAGMHDGVAEGTLLGGNLALVSKLVGTPYLPDLAGAILFVEDVGEEPYRLDGLLATLWLAGVLERLGGLVLGGFTDAAPTVDTSQTVDEVLAHYARFVPGPVARGLVYGHFPVKNTLPVGVRARLDVRGAAARLDVLDPVANAA